MNVYQQEMMDEVISGLTDYYPQLKLKAVRERVGNAVIVPQTGNAQSDYESARDLAEQYLIANDKTDTSLLIIDNYTNGACPDCDRKISKNVFEGSECTNCGHVFYSASEDNKPVFKY